tara:strand:- start:160 stop:1365 length:1206 start_codon:yes stop_codon:yes gene_type:complete
MSIGTSHLVLSTKAGAQYGWIMIFPILLANVLKYPFFEFGIRYTHTFKKSLLEGYADMGKKYLWGYTLITIVSALTLLAALYIVTAGLLKQLFPWLYFTDTVVALCLFIGISTVLILGRYKILEGIVKILLALLTVALIITTTTVLFKGPIESVPHFTSQPIFSEIGLLFMIGLMGWMPTAVEASSWVSLWRLEKDKKNQKDKNTSVDNSLKDTLTEFNLGYLLTAILAVFFLVIGWFTLYGSGIEMSASTSIFAEQLIQMFTIHMGEWSYFFIALAAFATMFSTCMTAHDAIARVGLETIKVLGNKKTTKWRYEYFIILLAILNFMVIWWAGGQMGTLVALATFVSFVFAPAVGLLNHKVVTQKNMPKESKVPKWLIILSYTGMIFLSLFALYYCSVVLF